ncbi:hypothetical protein MMC30_007063 [Trapelia coarctata]|nr:hypothetical protein [Trapelia coarctata]
MSPTTLPPRTSLPVHLLPHQTLRITNPHGTQVVDLWAISPLPPTSPPRSFLKFNYLSMLHTRSSLSKLSLSPGDSLRDNTRTPLLTLLEDTSGGVHDTLFAACDKHRYAQLGVQGYHASCAENLSVALGKAATSPPTTITSDESGANGNISREMKAAIQAAATATKEWTPDPLNLFMNVPVQAVAGGRGGELKLEAATCPKGGSVLFKAEQECVVVMSACPMDLSSIYVALNEVEFEGLDAA